MDWLASFSCSPRYQESCHPSDQYSRGPALGTDPEPPGACGCSRSTPIMTLPIDGAPRPRGKLLQRGRRPQALVLRSRALDMWATSQAARHSRRCFSSLQEADSTFRSSSEALIGIDVASAEQANSFSLCLPSRRQTTTAESTVGRSRAQPPQLLVHQELAMDRSHPTPRALEKPVHLQQRGERERERAV